MKIAIVSDSIYPYNKGGKEKRLFEIATRLVKYGHEITIYTMKWWEGADSIKENGYQLVSVGKLKNLYSEEKRRSLSQAIYFGFKVFTPLLKAKYDMLLVDHIPYLQLFSLKIVSIIKRKLFIADWHEVWGMKNWIEYLGPIKGWLAYIIEYWSVKMPNHIFSISDFTTKRLINNLNVQETKIITVPCGIDIKQINEARINDQYRSDCLFIGRLLKHKNVSTLLDAINIVKNTFKDDIKCNIIGDGPEKDNLDEKIKKLSLEYNVFIHGFLPNHIDVYSYIKSSKIFTFPSTREGFGIVVLEANACGKPVIGINNDFNASADLIQNDRNGYLVNLSAEEIAEKIILILKSNELKESMATKSIEYAKDFSWDLIVATIEKKYKEIYHKSNV